MPLLQLLGWLAIFIIVLGTAYWMITKYVPAELQKFPMLILVLICVIFAVYLIAALTGAGNVGNVHFGH